LVMASAVERRVRRSRWFSPSFYTLGAHEALSRPYALSGFLQVVHRLFEDGVFVGHDQSIRVGILRSPDCFAFSRERAEY
jgi:hypothetical protein